VAVAVDSRTIRLKKPDSLSMVEFLAAVGELSIDYKPKQRIVIDERTGTVVSGVEIEVEPVMITHGDITIKIEERSSLPPLKRGGDSLNVGSDIQLQPDQHALVVKRWRL